MSLKLRAVFGFLVASSQLEGRGAARMGICTDS
jgi:hypothetical protein